MFNKFSQEELDRILELAASFGMLMRLEPNKYTHVPICLISSSLPRTEFEKAQRGQGLFNKLVDDIARDTEWLYDKVENVVQVDDFSAHLVEISKKLHSEGLKQKTFLGLHRSDYMLHEPTNSLLQVELNTIASSFGGIATKLRELHELILTQYGHKFQAVPEPKNLPDNQSLYKLAEGIFRAHTHYGRGGTVMFLVGKDERNFFDQSYLEVELWTRW